MVVLFVWSASDASFGLAAWKARVALRLQSIPCNDPESAEVFGILDALRAIHWDGLGKRVIALCAIVGAGLASTAALAFFAFRPVKFGRIMLCVAVVATWGLLYATHRVVNDWRTRRQVAAIFPQIEQAGLALHKEWPVRSGEVPPGIEFYASPEKYPDVLSVRGRRDFSPFRERIGLMMTRGQQGIIRFDLAPSYDSTVEYHPEGTLPSAHQSGFGYPSPPVAAYHRLKDNWYLVRYGG